LRNEYPDGRYESWADIADDEWIPLKLDIDDARVRVSINSRLAKAPRPGVGLEAVEQGHRPEGFLLSAFSGSPG
jgi:hypothetical protein